METAPVSEDYKQLRVAQEVCVTLQIQPRLKHGIILPLICANAHVHPREKMKEVENLHKLLEDTQRCSFTGTQCPGYHIIQ